MSARLSWYRPRSFPLARTAFDPCSLFRGELCCSGRCWCRTWCKYAWQWQKQPKSTRQLSILVAPPGTPSLGACHLNLGRCLLHKHCRSVQPSACLSSSAHLDRTAVERCNWLCDVLCCFESDLKDKQNTCVPIFWYSPKRIRRHRRLAELCTRSPCGSLNPCKCRLGNPSTPAPWSCCQRMPVGQHHRAFVRRTPPGA